MTPREREVQDRVEETVILTRAEIRGCLQFGYDTWAIAIAKGIREADVWNALAATDARHEDLLREIVVTRSWPTRFRGAV